MIRFKFFNHVITALLNAIAYVLVYAGPIQWSRQILNQTQLLGRIETLKMPMHTHQIEFIERIEIKIKSKTSFLQCLFIKNRCKYANQIITYNFIRKHLQLFEFHRSSVMGIVLNVQSQCKIQEIRPFFDVALLPLPTIYIYISL